MPDPSPYVRVIVVVNHNNRTHPSAWMPRVDTITTDGDDAQRRVRALHDEEAAAGHRLPSLAVSQTTWVVPLPADVLTLIAELTTAGDCWFDHHSDTCPHRRAKALLAAARKEGLIPDA